MASIERTPHEHSLFIVTSNKIIHHASSVKEALFECEYAGSIVNARASKDNSSVVAVADSQVVILYDAAHRKDKTYKLKNGHVGRRQDAETHPL